MNKKHAVYQTDKLISPFKFQLVLTYKKSQEKTTR
jgi:hypothetical protein